MDNRVCSSKQANFGTVLATSEGPHLSHRQSWKPGKLRRSSRLPAAAADGAAGITAGAADIAHAADVMEGQAAADADGRQTRLVAVQRQLARAALQLYLACTHFEETTSFYISSAYRGD